jgi:3-methyladenine DNA glycosylase AlkD
VFREERYAVSALLGAPSVRRLRSMRLLVLYQDLIISGAWWDHVDELSHRVGELLAFNRAAMTPTLRLWALDPNIWIRRTSIIAQLGAKQETDTNLWSDTIEASIGEREFFLRKAIGWALREYARTDPSWVTEFVGAHPGLSPLSRREALKHL